MKRYDPEHAPNPQQWLALDEQLRIALAEQYHRGARAKPPNLSAHAIFHVIVENQIAEGLEPVVRAMARLRSEGLSRHESLHAIGLVVAEHVYDLFNEQADANNSQAIYNAAVERLSAKSWRGD